MFKKICYVLTLIVAAGFGATGCGTSLDFDGRYEVQNVNILADDVSVGESVRTEVFFETRVEADGDADGIEVVVKVSPALDYVPGTSRIYDDSTDESDLRSPDDVIRCADGSTFLFYDFMDSDLEDRSISGLSNFGFKFENDMSARSFEDNEFTRTITFNQGIDRLEIL